MIVLHMLAAEKDSLFKNPFASRWHSKSSLNFSSVKLLSLGKQFCYILVCHTIILMWKYKDLCEFVISIVSFLLQVLWAMLI